MADEAAGILAITSDASACAGMRFFGSQTKKSPTVQEVENCRARYSFSGGVEEGHLRRAGHSTPSMVVKISDCSREINVGTRMI